MRKNPSRRYGCILEKMGLWAAGVLKNPGNREFTVKICLDDEPLMCRMSSSLRWYPEHIIQMWNAAAIKDKFENNESADEWMDAYSCDRGCCWYFERLSYHWNTEPILSPQKMSLAFQANLISITAGHFSTSVSCNGETVKTSHPVTGQEYTLTLHSCKQIRNNFALTFAGADMFSLTMEK